MATTPKRPDAMAARIRTLEARIEAALDALVRDRAELLRLRARTASAEGAARRQTTLAADPATGTPAARKPARRKAAPPAKPVKTPPSPKPKVEAAPPAPVQRAAPRARAGKAPAPPKPAPTPPQKKALPKPQRRKRARSPREKEEDRKMRALRKAQQRLAALGVKPYKPKNAAEYRGINQKSAR